MSYFSLSTFNDLYYICLRDNAFLLALNIVIILLNVVDVVDVPSILNTFAHLIFITFQ